MSQSRRIQRRHQRGFTLTELMVSLVMGLIVAMAAVALARTATTTFHEQARSSTTEMSLRMASDRLRGDLLRVSYMSTGNIAFDPKISQIANDGGTSLASRYTATNRLRGLSIDVNMLTFDGGVPETLKKNGLEPDAIDMIGNFTTDESYTGLITTSGGGGSCNAAQTITLDPLADAATYHLAGGKSGVVTSALLLANAQAAFMPVAGSQFLAQVTDAIGCTNYVPVCNVAVDGANNLQVMVDARTNSTRAVLYANGVGDEVGRLGHSCGSSEGGKVSIAPLGHVRWYITASQANLTNEAVIDGDSKLDLVRETLDFDGATLTKEVVAEYATDLKFGIVIDDPKGTNKDRQVVFDIDTDTGNGNIYKTTSVDNDETIKPGGASAGPQRVRSVRYRIAIRASVADREGDLSLDAGAIKARYCTNPTATPPCTKYARIRTVTSEVALENQTGMFY